MARDISYGFADMRPAVSSAIHLLTAKNTRCTEFSGSTLLKKLAVT